MAEDYDDAPSSGTVSAFTASNARLETKMTEDPWTPDPYEVVNVREGANAYWVTLIFDAELLVTGAVRCDGVEVSVEVPLRQTDVKMDFALQVPLDYVSLSDEVVALTAKRLRLDGSGAIRPRLSAAKREVSSGDPFLLKGNTNKSNEVRRWWAAHEEVRVKMEIVREMLRDAPRLCAERLPMDKAEGGVEAMDNETWAQEGAEFDDSVSDAYESYARLLLGGHNDELVVSSSKRPAASLRSATAAADLRGVDSPLISLEVPLRRCAVRCAVGVPAAAAGSPGTPSLDALDAWAASLGEYNATEFHYNATGTNTLRWLAKCLRWHAYDYATCGIEKESADERFVVCASRYIEPTDRGGVAGPLLPSSELPGWWLEQLDGIPGGAMIAARLGGAFDCAAFAEAQRKVCVCSTETPAVTASARAVAANGAEPLGCVSEAVGSETDPIAGNRINDERNVQRRLESLGFDAGAGTSDPGHSRRLLLCAAAGIDDFEQPCDVGVTPCAVNTAECPAHRVSNRDTCLVDHPCALARIDPDEALPADHFSELVSTAALPDDRRRLRETPTATPEEVEEIRRRLIVNGIDQDDMENGMGHLARILVGRIRCWRLHWHVHLASRRAHGGALLRYRGRSTYGSCRARVHLHRGSCLTSRPGVPGEYNHRGCVARPPLRRYGRHADGRRQPPPLRTPPSARRFSGSSFCRTNARAVPTATVARTSRAARASLCSRRPSRSA